LPASNATSDQKLIEFADQQQRVLVSKDADFVDSHLLQAKPARLLLISTGNISNEELKTLLLRNVEIICELFATHQFVELTRDGVNAR
jgi:predicted nuclease of predicted toxin-antitoxin system